MPDNPASIYQQTAQAYTQEGPFSDYLKLHPAVNPVGPQFPEQGYPLHRAGIVANIGDTALRGLQRGRVMQYLMSEARNNQKYNSGLQQFADLDYRIDADNTLSDNEKRAQHDANASNRNAFVAYHWNERWQQANEGQDQGQGKQKKGKGKGTQGQQPKTQTAGTPSGMPEQPLSPQQQQQEQAQASRQNLGHALTSIFNHIAGPNMPTTAPANLDWIKARSDEVRNMRDPASVQQRQQDFLKTQTAQMEGKDQTERLQIAMNNYVDYSNLFGVQAAPSVIQNMVHAGYTFEQQQEVRGANDYFKMSQEQPRTGPPETQREGPPGAPPTPSVVRQAPGTPDDVKNRIRAAAGKYGVDPSYVLGLAESENSRFDQSATSRTGARGIFQFTQGTAKSEGIDRENIDQNIEGGVRYFKKLLDQNGGDVAKATAAFKGVSVGGATMADVAKAQDLMKKYATITPGALAGGYLNAQSAAPEYLKTAAAQAPSPVANPRGYQQTSIEPFLQPARNYSPNARRYITEVLKFKQPEWYLKDPGGQVHTVTQVDPGEYGPAHFLDVTRNAFVDVLAAQNAGWELSSYDPEKRADKLEIKTDPKGFDHIVDLNTGRERQVLKADGTPFKEKSKEIDNVRAGMRRIEDAHSRDFNAIDRWLSSFQGRVGILSQINALMDPAELMKLGLTSEESAVVKKKIEEAQQQLKNNPQMQSQVSVTLTDLSNKLADQMRASAAARRQQAWNLLESDVVGTGDDEAVQYFQSVMKNYNEANAAMAGPPPATTPPPASRDVDTSNIFIK